MSVFKIPTTFCDELRSMVSAFWWGSDNGRRKMSWVAWSKMCKPKCRGGLGFRDFAKFNKALLGKQAWRLMTNDTCLMARVLKGKYFGDRSFVDVELGHNPSYTWRSIWEAREVVMRGVRRRIGDGWSTSVWLDPWIPKTQSRRVISPRLDNEVEMKVAHLLRDDGLGWDRQKVSSLFLPFEQERVYSIRISATKPVDDWCWDFEKDGEYSVRSAYKLLFDDGSGIE
ncbi:putative mitochondrial protein AtMg00310 [Silene latifolia]|uniref:putative mitochondrial protein AtMg00310 n=1 Tax=Silene latifolia TaxID=37657 RepID=UPI003D7726EE